jgi:hypothetical protein
MAMIYRASLVSIVLVDYQGRSMPLGVAETFTLQKAFETEALREIGNFFAPEIVIHSAGASFSWGKAWVKGVDMVAEGIIPADTTIAAYEPFAARIIDQESQVLIATLYKAVPGSLDVAINAHQKLLQNVTGIAITANFSSELS